MQINGEKVAAVPLEIEEIESEIVAYNADSKKIIVFNKAASYVWHIIMDLSETGCNVTSEQIGEKLIEMYHIKEADRTRIYTDIEYILKQFFNEQLLYKVEM